MTQLHTHHFKDVSTLNVHHTSDQQLCNNLSSQPTGALGKNCNNSVLLQRLQEKNVSFLHTSFIQGGYFCTKTHTEQIQAKHRVTIMSR